MTSQQHDGLISTLISALEQHPKLPTLLSQALTHRSWINEHSFQETRAWHQSNERLEFLGDAVLGLVIAEELYKRYEQEDEGKLSKVKAYLVSAPILTEIARKINLGKGLRLGQGEIKNGGKKRDSILADTMEAVIGAVYLTLGLDKTGIFILRHWLPLLELIDAGQDDQDYKTVLQEMTQKQFGILPIYKVIDISGPDHDRFYEIGVEVDSEQYGLGKGKSKKEAEQKAASEAIKKIKKQTT